MYEFTTDRTRLDPAAIHAFLTASYWAEGIDIETVERSMADSMCFGFLKDGATVAFGRVVTDRATFAWLADVFVLPEHRGAGLGRRLVEGILADGRLSTLRRWVLRTADAHDLYRRYGFEEIGAPGMWMERVVGGVPRVTLRATSNDDVPVVQAWERHPENAAFVQVWSKDRHRRALTDPTQRHLILETGDRAVGFVILAGIGGAGSVVEFRRIVVVEKGRGIGKAAVARVLEYAFDELDASEVWLDFVEHNTRARHVYEKYGFRADPTARLSTEIDGERVPLVKMTLPRAVFERLERRP